MIVTAAFGSKGLLDGGAGGCVAAFGSKGLLDVGEGGVKVKLKGGGGGGGICEKNMTSLFYYVQDADEEVRMLRDREMRAVEF